MYYAFLYRTLKCIASCFQVKFDIQKKYFDFKKVFHIANITFLFKIAISTLFHLKV